MKEFMRYFGFTQRERRGLLVLAVLCFLLCLYPFIRKSLTPKLVISHSITAFPTDIIEEEESKEYSKYVARKPNLSIRKKNDISYFKFNPNHLSRSSWRKLGFSDKQIDVIYKYESKGGKFLKKEDLSKIYVIDEQKYKALESYIDIPLELVSGNEKVSDQSKISQKTLISFDINSADTIQLKQVKGIGSVLSNRIIKFRDALGGFHRVEQLQEVYGLSSECYQELLKHISLNPDGIKQLDLNSVTVEELQKHPYINRKQAQLIVNYRNQHGAYKDFTSLEKLHGLEPEFLRKIAAYLKF